MLENKWYLKVSLQVNWFPEFPTPLSCPPNQRGFGAVIDAGAIEEWHLGKKEWHLRPGWNLSIKVCIRNTNMWENFPYNHQAVVRHQIAIV